MNIVELLAAIGAENIMVQNLDNAAQRMDYSKKDGCVFIKFGTNGVTLNELLGETQERVGLVVWINRERFNELVKK